MEFKKLKESLLNHPDVTNVRRNDLILFTYSRECQFNNSWDDITNIARGIIFADSENKIIARPYAKFHNFSEYCFRDKIQPNQNYTLKYFQDDLYKLEIDRVTEKDDGSLGIFYWYENKWNCATKGSLTSEQSIEGIRLFKEVAESGLLNPEYTYLGEIVYKDNRIVINYHGWEGVILQTAFNTKTGEEIGFSHIQDIVTKFNNSLIKSVDVINVKTINDCVEYVSRNTDNKEGVVILFKNGIRIKMKNDIYLALHKLISNITDSRIKELLLAENDYDKVVALFPEEFKDDVIAIAEPIMQRIKDCCEKLSGYQKYKDAANSKKEFAISIKDVDPTIRWAYFCLYNGDTEEEVKLKIKQYILTH